RPRHLDHHVIRLDFELKLRAAVVCQRLTCECDAHAKALHKAKCFHGLGEVWIAIIGDSRPSKILDGHLTKWAARILDLNVIGKPSDPDGRVAGLVVAMKDRVASQ